jgi:ATP-dependent DNA helicase DinG
MNSFEALFEPAGPLARALPGFRAREGQLRMAEAVAAALADHGQLAVEAGTGTGKTFAYLVPALLSGRQAIVSTGTRTLQDQLFHRDLPLLGGALGRGVTVALLKGRSNYLCRERWLRLPRELGLDRAEAVLAARVALWAQETTAGDLAELPDLPDEHPLRERITSTRDNCTGARCAEFARCHVFAARRKANEADIVVVNHHLLLADLALKEEGYGQVLPSAEAFLLDEAHQLPELASQFFATQFSGRQAEKLLNELPARLVEAGHESDRLRPAEGALRRALAVFSREVGAVAGSAARLAWPEEASALDGAAAKLVTALAELSDALHELGGGEGLEAASAQAAELAGALDAVASAGAAEGARLVQAGRGYGCQLVPFEVGTRFRALIEARRAAWIFTSATLAIEGDFAHFQRRLGLDDRCATLCIDSPFDYARQALLYLPQGMPLPAAPEYTDAVVDIARRLIAAGGGGAFLLFTSHRALEAAARALRTQPPDGGVLLVQGEAPRDKLLRAFRDAGDAVLLGTASFWEGVDVKGPALRLVVIDRLPFTSPDDPVLRARIARAREAGDDPFQQIQVPEAALVLKQGVGRLVRSEEDRGVVVICDPRLTGRGYGRRLLDALPPMRRSRDREVVLEFLRGLRDEADATARKVRA